MLPAVAGACPEKGFGRVDLDEQAQKVDEADRAGRLHLSYLICGWKGEVGMCRDSDINHISNTGRNWFALKELQLLLI